MTSPVCLRCRRPALRIDSGVLSEIHGPWIYYAAGERIIWCPTCEKLIAQRVEIRLEDKGEVDRKLVPGKLQPKGEGL